MFARSMASVLVFMAIISAGCASSERPVQPDELVPIPEDLRVDGPIVAHVHATGFQVYTCTTDISGKLVWVLKAPDATFEGDNGIKGKHYAGPTWESSDGSKITGKKIVEHASGVADAVPWLLLSVTSLQGTGIFSNVTYIQRINTNGGKAPHVGDAKVGDEVRIPYTAEYVFYGLGATAQPTKP
jgi:hypothetical protein